MASLGRGRALQEQPHPRPHETVSSRCDSYPQERPACPQLRSSPLPPHGTLETPPPPLLPPSASYAAYEERRYVRACQARRRRRTGEDERMPFPLHDPLPLDLGCCADRCPLVGRHALRVRASLVGVRRRGGVAWRRGRSVVAIQRRRRRRQGMPGWWWWGAWACVVVIGDEELGPALAWAQRRCSVGGVRHWRRIWLRRGTAPGCGRFSRRDEGEAWRGSEVG